MVTQIRRRAVFPLALHSRSSAHPAFPLAAAKKLGPHCLQGGPQRTHPCWVVRKGSSAVRAPHLHTESPPGSRRPAVESGLFPGLFLEGPSCPKELPGLFQVCFSRHFNSKGLIRFVPGLFSGSSN